MCAGRGASENRGRISKSGLGAGRSWQTNEYPQRHDDRARDPNPISCASRAGGGSTSKFIDKRRIGNGAFGEVWQCERKDDGALFAKKKLTSADPDCVMRFQREVRIL